MKPPIYCPPSQTEKTRKLIDLDNDTIKVLQSKADKDNRSLKNYIETMLVKHSKR